MAYEHRGLVADMGANADPSDKQPEIPGLQDEITQELEIMDKRLVELGVRLTSVLIVGPTGEPPDDKAELHPTLSPLGEGLHKVLTHARHINVEIQRLLEQLVLR